MIVVILTEAEYNKNVITIHKNFNKNVILMHVYINKSVKECVYGTTDYEEAAGLEKFHLPQTADLKVCAPAGQDLGSQRIRQALL